MCDCDFLFKKTRKMEDIFKTRISCYRCVTDTLGTVMTLGEFLFSDKYKNEIESLRAMEDAEERKKRKMSLPQATISGIFAPTRKACNLIEHSGLLCVDLDKKDNQEVTWFDSLDKEWHNLPQILYAAHSVGGRGWFAIFRLAHPERHRSQFAALEHDFAREGLTIDRSCRDLCRLRVITYDASPYINRKAIPYDKVWTEPEPVHVPYRGCDDTQRVEACCREIASRGIDITAGYDNWFHIGAALASLGESGRGYFHLCSSQNEGYKAAETDRKFNSLLKDVRRISIGTFFHICSQYGITGKEEQP
jgi:hypothetical protein